MVLEDPEEVFHKAEADDRNGECLNEFAVEVEASEYNKLQRSHLLARKGKNVHRARVLHQRLAADRPQQSPHCRGRRMALGS